MLLSWNTDGMSEEGFKKFLGDVAALKQPWDAIFFQEGPKEVDTKILNLDSGHVWCIAACGDRPHRVVIALNRKWRNLWNRVRAKTVEWAFWIVASGSNSGD